MKSLNKSEKDGNLFKFEAVFYSDLKLLKHLIITEDDLILFIPIPTNRQWLWDKKTVCIHVLDILNWISFGIYEYSKNDDYPDLKRIYENSIECSDWVCETFSIKNYDLKDYSQFRVLRHCLVDEENWINEDEMKQAINDGFRQLDLDLINEAEKGNGISVYKLMKQGANYKIDPDDYTNESLILDILASDFSFCLLWVKGYLSKRNEFSFSESYTMLEKLYQIGVSNYIMDVILMNDEI